jgi:hypothetical protein
MGKIVICSGFRICTNSMCAHRKPHSENLGDNCGAIFDCRFVHDEAVYCSDEFLSENKVLSTNPNFLFRERRCKHGKGR